MSDLTTLRASSDERIAFASSCSGEVAKVASALIQRFKELGIRAPFEDDDVAWFDLADVALRAIE